LKILTGKALAGNRILNEKKCGRLAHPSTQECVDCGRTAECYDHRDYGRPLDVEPVCRACNVIRGPAKPLNQFIVAYVLLAAAQQPAQPLQGS
jgi:uncharacterized OB-fold protein